MARVYLSARFGRHVEMCEVAAALAGLGHTIVSTWHSSAVDGCDNANAPDAAEVAVQDVDEVYLANVFVAFTDGEPGRGGRHVELGVAIGRRFCRLIVVGPVEHHFHRLPYIERVPDKRALYTLLGVAR